MKRLHALLSGILLSMAFSSHASATDGSSHAVAPPSDHLSPTATVPSAASLAAGENALRRGDYVVALAQIKPWAEKGNAAAQADLGLMYEHGYGLSQNCALAISWLQRAISQGSPAAENDLGSMYNHGNCASKDYVKAVAWYHKAAAAGSSIAQVNLGAMYANGSGTPQDYAEALSWFRRAALQGNDEAQFDLGVMYDHGRGVPQDYAAAVSWYGKAAEQGNVDAMNNLGVEYRNGRAVPQSSIVAYALYNLSSSFDSSDTNQAVANRDELTPSMTTAQIDDGQALTRQMKQAGILKALDTYHPTRVAKVGKRRDSNRLSPPTASSSDELWPAAPAKHDGALRCNTRCTNGSCYRTYGNGRHVHFQATMKMDPFSNEMIWDPGNC